MSKPIIPVNFTDDIIAESMNGKRRYRMINNADGTISLEDVTEYEQEGSNFGAAQVNSIAQGVNQSVDANKVIENLSDIGALTQSGYVPDALAVKQLNNNLTALIQDYSTTAFQASGTQTKTINFGKTYQNTNYIAVPYIENLSSAGKVRAWISVKNKTSSSIDVYFDTYENYQTQIKLHVLVVAN